MNLNKLPKLNLKTKTTPTGLGIAGAVVSLIGSVLMVLASIAAAYVAFNNLDKTILEVFNGLSVGIISVFLAVFSILSIVFNVIFLVNYSLLVSTTSTTIEKSKETKEETKKEEKAKK